MKLPHNIQVYWDKGEESKDFLACCGILADILQALGSDSKTPTPSSSPLYNIPVVCICSRIQMSKGSCVQIA